VGANKLWTAKTRIYFNRHVDAPLVWSVDQGSVASRVKIAAIQIRLHVATQYLAVNQRPSNTEEPAAWLEAELATVYVIDDIAYICNSR
jgi:hypothetical protein